MMHFFRRSKIHLDCFTSKRGVIEYAPVVNAIEAIPDWWRALPKQLNVPHPAATMKTCVGMYDYYNKSVAMPLWSDLFIKIVNKKYEWQFSDMETIAEVHSSQQYEGFLGPNYGHIKLVSPWLFFTKEDTNWLLTAPVYNRTSLDTFSVAEGVLNFSKQNATNVQLFLPLHTDRGFVIPFKTTFMFTPMSDKKVVLHRHLISEEEYRSKESASFSTTFINKYRTHERIVKCPYKDETK